MHDPAAFAKLVPGFDFLRNLTQNAGASMPAVGHWIAPTLDPKELEKRIEELRTVQFWLEQNARMLGATIQALEVQRMTLSTLSTMNVSLGDLTESLKIRMPEAATQAPAARPPDPAPAAPAVPPGVIDPMKWWGALTQQFTELATQAMNEGAVAASGSGSAAPGKPAAGKAPGGGSRATPRARKPAAKAAPRQR